MALETQPTTPRRPRGRPVTPAPDGRDLAAEVVTLKQWMEERPGIKPETISKAAGLHRAAFGNILRGHRAPQVAALDALYEALKPYEYTHKPNDYKNNRLENQ